MAKKTEVTMTGAQFNAFMDANWGELLKLSAELLKSTQLWMEDELIYIDGVNRDVRLAQVVQDTAVVQIIGGFVDANDSAVQSVSLTSLANLWLKAQNSDVGVIRSISVPGRHLGALTQWLAEHDGRLLD